MIEPYTTKTTTEIVNALLSKIPPYGDFNIKDLLRGGQYIEGDAINIENLGIVSPLQITDVYNYLVSNGYANKRNDISAISVEFTDRGRKLKQCGSIEIFNLLDLEKKRSPAKKIW